jgi:hypothetical protein
MTQTKTNMPLPEVEGKHCQAGVAPSKNVLFTSLQIPWLPHMDSICHTSKVGAAQAPTPAP